MIHVEKAAVLHACVQLVAADEQRHRTAVTGCIDETDSKHVAQRRQEASQSRNRKTAPPQIGQLAPGLWFAQAFGGHGVAPTTAAGEWLADAISGRAHLPAALQSYGLTPVFGQAGLLAAQASYSWAELRDVLRERLI